MTKRLYIFIPLLILTIVISIVAVYYQQSSLETYSFVLLVLTVNLFAHWILPALIDYRFTKLQKQLIKPFSYLRSSRLDSQVKLPESSARRRNSPENKISDRSPYSSSPG